MVKLPPTPLHLRFTQVAGKRFLLRQVDPLICFHVRFFSFFPLSLSLSFFSRFPALSSTQDVSRPGRSYEGLVVSLDDFIIPRTSTPTSFQLASSVDSNGGATLSQQVASAASIDPGNSNSNRLETNKRGNSNPLHEPLSHHLDTKGPALANDTGLN